MILMTLKINFMMKKLIKMLQISKMINKLKINMKVINKCQIYKLTNKEELLQYFTEKKMKKLILTVHLIKRETRFNCKSQFSKRKKKLKHREIFKKISISFLMARMRKMLNKQVDIISFKVTTQKMDFVN